MEQSTAHRSLSTSKQSLYNHFWTMFHEHFDPADICIYHIEVQIVSITINFIDLVYVNLAYPVSIIMYTYNLFTNTLSLNNVYVIL